MKKCKCKIFYEFNKDANEILNSKTKHFVFNNNIEKNRQKLLHLKNFESNILNILISEDKKNILSKYVKNIKLDSMNYKEEECIVFNKNDHIDSNILNILKDVYVDVEYLPEYNDYCKTGNITNTLKLIVFLMKIVIFIVNKSQKLQNDDKIEMKKQIDDTCFIESKGKLMFFNFITNIQMNC